MASKKTTSHILTSPSPKPSEKPTTCEKNLFNLIQQLQHLNKLQEELEQANQHLQQLELQVNVQGKQTEEIITNQISQLYFKATDPFSERWQSAWIISAFWNILTFALLGVICALWAPSQNSTRYAYSDESGENFDDEDALPLKSSMTFEPEKASLKPEKKERKAVNSDVFSLDDDTEEDKRE